MSRTGAVTLQFADSEYEFRLRLKQLMELDEKFEAGPAFMLTEFASGKWRLPWVRDIIRLGLIGGGETPAKAFALVRDYVDDRPLLETALHAQAILSAAVIGFEGDETVEKPEALAEQMPTGHA